jgi:hypothetical protein
MDLSGSVDGWAPMPYRGSDLERSYARRGARVAASSAPGQRPSRLLLAENTDWRHGHGDVEDDGADDDDDDDAGEDAENEHLLLDSTTSEEEGNDASLVHRCGCKALANSRRCRRRALPWCLVLTLAAICWWLVSEAKFPRRLLT